MSTLDDIDKGLTIASNIASLFGRVAEAITGEKEEMHGDKIVNHQNIADGWNWWLGMKYGIPPVIRPSDVAQMQTILKQARATSGTYQADDGFDQVGYSGIYAGLAEVEETSALQNLAQAVSKIDGKPLGPPAQVVKRHTRNGKTIKSHARRKPTARSKLGLKKVRR